MYIFTYILRLKVQGCDKKKGLKYFVFAALPLFLLVKFDHYILIKIYFFEASVQFYALIIVYNIENSHKS